MLTTRLGLILIAAITLGGCSVLPFVHQSANGVTLVGKTEYCGTPSQASEVYYFPNPDAFQNWIDFRNVNGFNANMARNGLVVVGMGQRPTGGYNLTLDKDHTGIKNGVLSIGLDWHAPRQDAAVSQALTSECVALQLPPGQYQTIKVKDQLGIVRGTIHLSKKNKS